MEKNQTPLKTLEELNYFLSNAPKNWKNGEIIRRFQLYEHDYISCVFWENQHYITGTDIVKAITYRFKIQGHEIKNVKKFEEGIFSDLRNLKPGIDSLLEEPKSPFLELLYKNKCIRTQKKQKVFFWYSVPYDRLYQDVLKRDRKRELNGKRSNIVIDKSKSIKRELSGDCSNSSDMEIIKNESEINKSSPCSNVIYSKWVDETQKLNNSNSMNMNVDMNMNTQENTFEMPKIKCENYKCENDINHINIKKEEIDNPQLKKSKKGKKYIITKYFAKGQVDTSLKFVCDKKDCNKKFKKLEDLVKHKNFAHGQDKIGYNYSKDFMYVEKNLSPDKNENTNKNQYLSPPTTHTGNTSYILSPLELEDDNNNWSIIVPPSDETMPIGNVSSADLTTSFSLNDFTLSNIPNPNESVNMNLDIRNLSTISLYNMNMQNSNPKVKNLGRDNRLSISSNATLNNPNNSNILSTSSMDFSDTSMNTTFMSNQTLNNSSIIVQSNDTQDSIVLNNEEQIRQFISQLMKNEEMNFSSTDNSPLISTKNVNQSPREAIVPPQSKFVTTIPSTTNTSVQQPQCLNNCVPNVNDVTIPTAHFMALDSPIQKERNNYLKNIPVRTQSRPRYVRRDQYGSNHSAAQYVPTFAERHSSRTPNNNRNYISYELTTLINQVTNAPSVNVYVAPKANEPVTYISPPSSPMDYQRMTQSNPPQHTAPSHLTSTQPHTIIYNLSPSEPTPTQTTMGHTQYINPQPQPQPQPQYIQVQAQPQQQIYISHENIPNMVQMQYQ